MKDSPKANFPIHFTISCDNKIDKLAKKNSPQYLSKFSGYQTVL